MCFLFGERMGFFVFLSLSLFISSFEVDALDETEVSSTIMMMMNRRSAFLGWCCAFLWHDDDEEKGLLDRRESIGSCAFLVRPVLANQRSTNGEVHGVPLADARERERAHACSVINIRRPSLVNSDLG